MTLLYSENFRKYLMGTKEKFFVGGQMKLFSDGPPRSIFAKDPPGLIATLHLWDGWTSKAEGQVTSRGFPASFRLYSPDGKCGMQGSAGVGGDLGFDGADVEFLPGQIVTIEEFNIVSGNKGD